MNSGKITCPVAWADDEVSGYLKVVWDPSYPPLRDRRAAEIRDPNVLVE